jgi:uncharacterized membrane protein YfcA
VRLLLTLPLGLLIGVALGALGGGGSILAVPVLVYAVGLEPKEAVTTSLVVVGVAALGGMVGHWRAGHVRVAAGLWFGLAGVAGSLLGSRLNRMVDPQVLLISFSGIMVIAAWRMWASTRQRPRDMAVEHTALSQPCVPAESITSSMSLSELQDQIPNTSASRFNSRVGLVIAVIAAGTTVGFMTGFFGVGGGFIIVPTLVLILGFDMPVAVGTSLLVIAINSGVALATRMATTGVDWHIALPFTVAALVGAVAGHRMTNRLPSSTLIRWFVVLLIAVAGYTFTRSITG